MAAPQTTNTKTNRINWLAVISGFLLDLLISTLVAGIAAQFDPELSNQISLSTTVGIVTFCLLVLSTGVGGWVAGRMARTEFVLHGVLVGGMGIFTLLIQSLYRGQAQPLSGILLQCMCVAAGGIGGWLSGRKLASRQ
jgi:putative membrane protein (TIGR04086 family)